jgi:hypothetical protein
MGFLNRKPPKPIEPIVTSEHVLDRIGIHMIGSSGDVMLWAVRLEGDGHVYLADAEKAPEHHLDMAVRGDRLSIDWRKGRIHALRNLSF